MTENLFIVWKDEFSVGSQIIDAQHAGLIDLINRLYHGVQQSVSPKQQRDILQQLQEYAGTHFVDEENIMREHEFPGLAQHYEAHEVFTRRVRQFVLDAGTTQDISFEILTFLKEWLIKHILHMDHQYIPFITSSNEDG